MKNPDRRSPNRDVRPRMWPWSHDAFGGARQTRRHAHERSLVSVEPTAHQQSRGLDLLVVLADGPVLPIVIPMRMLKPYLQRTHHVVESLIPHRSPALS